MHYELCIMHYFWAFRLRFSFAVGLSALSLLAKFFLAQKSLPNSQIPFPVPKSRPLAKDAAPIPNAEGLRALSIELRAVSKVNGIRHLCPKLIAHCPEPKKLSKYSGIPHKQHRFARAMSYSKYVVSKRRFVLLTRLRASRTCCEVQSPSVKDFFLMR